MPLLASLPVSVAAPLGADPRAETLLFLCVVFGAILGASGSRTEEGRVGPGVAFGLIAIAFATGAEALGAWIATSSSASALPLLAGAGAVVLVPIGWLVGNAVGRAIDLGAGPAPTSALLLGAALMTAGWPTIVESTLGYRAAITLSGVLALVSAGWSRPKRPRAVDLHAPLPAEGRVASMSVRSGVRAIALGAALGVVLARVELSTLGDLHGLTAPVSALMIAFGLGLAIMRRGGSRTRAFCRVAVGGLILFAGARMPTLGELLADARTLQLRGGWKDVPAMVRPPFIAAFVACLAAGASLTSVQARERGRMLWTIAFVAAIARILPRTPGLAAAICIAAGGLLLATAASPTRPARRGLLEVGFALVAVALLSPLCAWVAPGDQTALPPGATRVQTYFGAGGARIDRLLWPDGGERIAVDGVVDASSRDPQAERRLLEIADHLVGPAMRTLVLGPGAMDLVGELGDRDEARVVWVTPEPAEVAIAIARGIVDPSRVERVIASPAAYLSASETSFDRIVTRWATQSSRWLARNRNAELVDLIRDRLTPGGLHLDILPVGFMDAEQAVSAYLGTITDGAYSLWVDHPRNPCPVFGVFATARGAPSLSPVLAAIMTGAPTSSGLKEVDLDARGVLQCRLVVGGLVARARTPVANTRDRPALAVLMRPRCFVSNSAASRLLTMLSWIRNAAVPGAIETLTPMDQDTEAMIRRDHQAICRFIDARSTSGQDLGRGPAFRADAPAGNAELVALVRAFQDSPTLALVRAPLLRELHSVPISPPDPASMARLRALYQFERDAGAAGARTQPELGVWYSGALLRAGDASGCRDVLIETLARHPTSSAARIRLAVLLAGGGRESRSQAMALLDDVDASASPVAASLAASLRAREAAPSAPAPFREAAAVWRALEARPGVEMR